jgi:ATP-dependent DNA helicase RecG
VERSGQGLNLMVESAVRHSKPLPSFAGSAPHEVRLTQEGSAQDSAFIKYLERLGQDLLRHFSTYDFLTLDALCHDRPLSDGMRARIPGLVEIGAVESVGKGRGVRHLLSRGLYASLGKSGSYTQRRGLDHETNKALLVAHLSASAVAGAPLSELCQVLPAQSTSAVRRLLRELRSEGRATLRGLRKAARWFPGPVIGQDERGL